MTQEIITSASQQIAPTQSQIPTITGAESVMNLIAEAAMNPEMDIAKLEKLMDLQQRLLDRDAKAAFDADFVKMKPELPVIARRKNNDQTKKKYAPLEDINREIDPILSRYGFGTGTRIIKQDTESVTVEATLRHRAGHYVSNEITMPLDRTGIAGSVNKTMVHAIASTVTYCKRVAICALLNISTGDDKDGNNEREERLSYITTEQAIEIDAGIKEAGIDRVKFFEWAKTMNEEGESVQDSRFIFAKHYSQAIKIINDRKKENVKKLEA